MKYTEENYKNAKRNDEFEFICKKCGKPFTKTKGEISRNKCVPQYCCKDCALTSKNMGNIEVKCEECGKTKVITVSEYNKSTTKRFFCNHSCSASYNNKHIKKVTKNSSLKVCPLCGGKKEAKSKICYSCREKQVKDEMLNKRLGEYIGFEERKTYLGNKLGAIRRNAKEVLKHSDIPCECAYCHNHEFDAILEAHHKTPITDFPPETLISEVNSIDNLMYLCPNHHRLVHLGVLKF